MSLEYDLYELIERYLNGELSESEKFALEQKIALDPEFSSEVAWHKMTALVVKGADQDRIREKVRKDIDEFDQQNKSRSIKTWTGLSILLILTGVSSLLYFINRPKEEKSILLNTDMQWHNTPATQPSTPSSEADLAKPNVANSKLSTPKTQTILPTGLELLEQNEHSIPEAKSETVYSDKKSDIHSSGPEKLASTNNESRQIEKASFDCSTTHIEVSPKITATCEHTSNGIINFEGAEFIGGKSPYQITLVEKNKHISNTLFYELEEGLHSFEIVDFHGCVSMLAISVPAKRCGENKFAFSVALGESIKIPVLEHQSYNFIIRNRAGQIIYSLHGSPNSYQEWDGASNSGQHVYPDLYIYTIEYDNGTIEKGQITISR